MQATHATELFLPSWLGPLRQHIYQKLFCIMSCASCCLAQLSSGKRSSVAACACLKTVTQEKQRPDGEKGTTFRSSAQFRLYY